MMMNKKISVITLSMLLGVMVATSARADDDDTAEMQAVAQSAGLLTLEEASEKALAVKAGTIVEADLDRRLWPLAGWDYEFDIVDAQGQKWEVEIDAKTGESRRVLRDYF
jgi:uncharacterized membrane protein YkoI